MSITNEERKYLLLRMKWVLDDNRYDYSESALNKIIDVWAQNKGALIEAFKRHPNYIEGKFMIAFDSDYDRDIDRAQSIMFSRWLLGVYPEIKEYIPVEITELIQRINKTHRDICNIADEEYNVYKFPRTTDDFLNNLNYYAQRTLDEEIAKELDAEMPNAHIHANEKTSRAVNKICTYLGYSKHPDYNKEFAKYADSLSPLKIKRHTVLSLNPLDYLLMSKGNSWTSCHSIIDRGCYSSGTISYMLDGTSMVLYTVDSSYNGNDYYDQPKINRQMFHWAEEKLVQGRLYPQSNDSGSKDAYDAYRAIVQKIISEIYDFPNRWKVTHGANAARQYIYSEGTHYTDYCYYDNCTLSRVRDSENENCFTVGHEPICIDCGEYHDCEESINCCTGRGYICADCGEWISEDDIYWVNDNPYCSNCVTWCESCNEYELNNNVTYIEREDRYVCLYCLENYYTCCDECGEYVKKDCITYIEGEDIYVCDDCLSDCFERCSECGNYFRSTEIIINDDGNPYCSDCYESIKEDEVV